jgi:hypothetical protein
MLPECLASKPVGCERSRASGQNLTPRLPQAEVGS